jgi:hypothetical protein
MAWDSFRLARLTVPAKLLMTFFLLIVGPGYLFGVANIMFQHQDADLEDGLTLDDMKRTFHGLKKTIQPEDKVTVDSMMLEQVREGGDMREYLEEGGQPAIRGLIKWLENEAKEEEFVTVGLVEPDDPSAQSIITDQCVSCHNSDGGDMEDIPYAATADDEAEYELVMETATAEVTRERLEPETLELAPTGEEELVHITHAHILTIPVFTLLVGVLFLMTGFGPVVKFLLAPLPMLAVMADIGSWWLARYSEPFIYVIAAAGAVFGATYALQILGILLSMWFGRKGEEPSAAE